VPIEADTVECCIIASYGSKMANGRLCFRRWTHNMYCITGNRDREDTSDLLIYQSEAKKFVTAVKAHTPSLRPPHPHVHM
jgi:hypothetical protein